METPRKISFEYRDYGNPPLRVVALDSRLRDYDPVPRFDERGRLTTMRTVEKTVKDCRYIDGCIYLHLGRVTDAVMVDLIEKFRKMLKDRTVRWTRHDIPPVTG